MQIVLMLLLATPLAVPTYRCNFIKAEPKIDGIIDEQWKDATWTSEFVDVATGEPAPLKARMKLMWDEKNLYIAAEVEDPNIQATMKNRDDQLWQENALEMFIDPDADGLNYVEMQINPHNAVMDLLLDKPYLKRGRPKLDWNADVRSAVHVDGTINDASDKDRGWTMEMAIPLAAFADLGPGAKNGVKWRIELTRVLGDHQNDAVRKHWAWAPTGKVNYHMPEKWGWLEFIRE